MAPRYTVPAPKTESAREARKSFFCELCQKGYSRMNEFEAHEGSYDHQHKKRLKEMKQMHRNPEAARRAERKADSQGGLITVKPIELKSTSGSGGGFKKGGFKSAFSSATPAVAPSNDVVPSVAPIQPIPELKKSAEGEGDSEDELEWEYYDPRKPTGCGSDCKRG